MSSVCDHEKVNCQLQKGEASIEDEDRSRRSVPVSILINIDAVHTMVLSDRQIGLIQISKTLSVLFL